MVKTVILFKEPGFNILREARGIPAQHPPLDYVAYQFVEKNELPPVKRFITANEGLVAILADDSQISFSEVPSVDSLGERRLSKVEHRAFGVVNGTHIDLRADSLMLEGYDVTARNVRVDRSPYWFLTPGHK